MKLAHFYHVFADGDFVTPLREHLDALDRSGLRSQLDKFFIGIVGSKENRMRVLDEVAVTVIAEAETGWEQVTLKKLHEYSKRNIGAVFYAHTKGAWSQSELARQWRVSMTKNTVTRWQECVHALKSVQAVGPYWLLSQEPEHVNHNYFFAGNFWWARTDYVKTLPPLKNETRFDAEGWIGLNDPTVRVMKTGYATWGNFD